MSKDLDRRHFVGIVARLRGNGLVDLSRGALLAQAMGAAPAVASLTLEDLDAIPPWLMGAASERQRLAQHAAIALAAPLVRQTIDGATLRRLASVVGEAMIDWAMAIPLADPPAPLAAQHRIIDDPASLERYGSAILRESLPVALRPLLSNSDDTPDAASVTIAAAVAVVLSSVGPL